ncbi:uncharacterized protein LOC127900839 [Citrus sinensis]|uniref:uncharacterized protein LOC127900839 n=1 Tax=Citrus sinensis TaxID=2711 RepID=UPI0022778E02|nr:uncharacterized protein LOC127900839 [Citrus sinensis]
METGGSSAQGGDRRLNDSVTLREIVSEAREKVMFDRMERMEKQMETLTTILHELRSERGVTQEGRVRGSEVAPEETELRQHVHDVEQERDQVAAHDPGRAVQLEEEVRRLAQIIDDMQGKNRAPAAYEQAKRDIEIEEEKAARIRTDQLEGLGRKEKKALPGNGPIRRRDHQASGGGAGGRIPMYEQDKESTAFITNQGLFCYRVMPFGLKNAGATYQRLVNKVFKPLIGKTMEVYVDDMVTKSKIPKEHVRHLEETFELLRKYKMKLNPEKCAFGVESGKFLGFMVSHRGIETNLEKIQAIV